MSARLTPHVLFALRRAHGHALRELGDARVRMQRTEEAVEEARLHLAQVTAEEAELRAALEAHVDAVNAPAAVPTSLLAAQAADTEPDTRRARESWEQ